MNRKELATAILAAANGASFSPVQIQKAVFLVSRNLPSLISNGEPFDFKPYDYGPFDRAVYQEIQSLRSEGMALVGYDAFGRYDTYSASPEGVAVGKRLLDSLAPAQRDYIRQVADWVRRQTFASLVKSIYEAYPEMRANSIFK